MATLLSDEDFVAGVAALKAAKQPGSLSFGEVVIGAVQHYADPERRVNGGSVRRTVGGDPA